MNALVIGADKAPLLHHIEHPFLIVDDGPIIDRLTLPKRRAVTVFDPDKHAFNPVKDIDYRTAEDFVHVLEAVFPGGENTLTKQNTSIQVLEALLDEPESLDTLITDTKDTHDAYQKIRRLLLSPVLKRVLNRPTNLSFKARQEGERGDPCTIIARLDRAVLGDFDAFVLGNLLISRYEGAVIIPDFGFYAHRGHARLIREGRLIAGIHSFDEVPKFRHQLVQIERKIGSRCTPDDAEILARYSGHPKDTKRYREFIEECIA